MDEFWKDLPPLPDLDALEPSSKRQRLETSYEDLDSFSDTNLLSGTIFCEEKASIAAAIASLEFLSDHRDAMGAKLLVPSPAKETFVWTDDNIKNPELIGTTVESIFGTKTGTFQKPEWEPAQSRNSPASHTKDQAVRISVTFRFTVTGFPLGTVSRVEGASTSGPTLHFAADVAHIVGTQPSDLTLQLTSAEALPNAVMVIDDLKIQWTLAVSSTVYTGPIDAGESGPHTIFLTFGAPSGRMDYQQGYYKIDQGALQAVTVARLQAAIEAVQEDPDVEPNEERDHVDAMFRAFDGLDIGYELGYRWQPTDQANETFLKSAATQERPDLQHYLWLCNRNIAKGECHVIAAGFALACRILGLTKAFEIGYMFPWPSRQDAPGFPKRTGDDEPENWTSPYTGAKPTGTYYKGKYSADMSNRYKRSPTRRVYNGVGAFQACGFVDDNDGRNNYEGVLCYAGKYLYAIGEGIFDLEEDADLNATLFYSDYQLKDLKVTRVENRGAWKLFFGVNKDNLDQDPYPEQGLAYESAAGAACFRWHD